MFRLILPLLLAAAAAVSADLRISIIDVEGGKAVLMVTPGGESMLVDAGWPGGTSAARILDAAKAAQVRRIDALLITHFDIDHLGDVAELASKIPIGHIYDHGDYQGSDPDTRRRFEAYRTVRDRIGHTTLQAGDRVPFPGVDVEVLTAGGRTAVRDGAPNPLCNRYPQAAAIASDFEDDRSIGLLVTYAGFRMLDLADLEAHPSRPLVCPANGIGTVDLFNVNVHGQFKGIAPELVGVIGARVMVQANGETKGADASTWPVLSAAPGHPDIWQLHRSPQAGNPPADFIANPSAANDAFHRLDIAVNAEGVFRVANTRNGFARTYPSTSLARHDFFYAGESKAERMFIVRGGKIAWQYTHPGKGEISDAALLPDGNVLFAHQYAITEVTTDKRVVWNYEAPPGTEIHTAMPVGASSVLFIQNGNPAKAVTVNKATGTVEHEFVLPVKDPASVHGQFRRARLTRAGTLLVAHMDLGKIVDYDLDGRALWSIDAPGAWSATPLENGNVLIAGSSGKYVREVNRQGATVWAFTAADAPGIPLSNVQTAARLANGNTLINDWFNEWSGQVDTANPPVQAFEVTPEKKVVWVLRSWLPPADLGPSTTIQILK